MHILKVVSLHRSLSTYVKTSSTCLGVVQKKAQFETTIERHIFSKLDMVEALCSRMEEHLKKVQICRTQFEHLVQQYLEEVRKVNSMYNEAFQTTILCDLYLSEKLQSCSGCLWPP